MVETQALGAASHIIKRPRLTKILDETEARVILLCAPAGYGKTTLAREWVATRTEPVLWYSGGPAMADVAALAVDLAELFDPEGEASQTVSLLIAAGQPPRALAKALARHSPVNALVVIDDYHHADETDESRRLIEALIFSCLSRFLLTSRIRPQWLSSRSVVYGEAEILFAEQMAFDSEEAAMLLPKTSCLAERARGWPAVIGLGLLRKDTSVPLEEGEPSELYEFFASELYVELDGDLRRNLLMLAAGADISRPVSLELFGDDTDVVLRAASDRGFLSAGSLRAPRLHPMLREFLLGRLSELDSAAALRIVQVVIQALANDRRWSACLALLESAPNGPIAAQTLSRCLPELLASGRVATVRQWVDLAKQNGFAQPIFVLAEAEIAFRAGRGREAQALGSLAARQLKGDEAARAYLVVARGAHLIEHTQNVASNAALAFELARDVVVRQEALWLSFLAAFENQAPDTREHLARLREFDGGNAAFALRASCAEGIHYFENGSPKKALQTAEAAQGLLRLIDDPLLSTNFLNLLVSTLVVTGAYTRALEVADQQSSIAIANGLDFVVGYSHLARIGAYIGQRKLRSARQELSALSSLDPPPDSNVAGNATILESRLRIAAGDLEGAARSLAIVPQSPIPPALRGEFCAYRGLIRASLGETKQAAADFEQALELSRYVDAAAITQVGRAIMGLWTGENGSAARQAVRNLLTIGHVDAVVTSCRAYPELAAVCAEDLALHRDLTTVFAESRDVDLARRAGIRIPREMRRSDGLTAREIQVLDLLCQGRTNVDIASALFISQSTAKVHVKHIFEKLGVRSRAEAARLWAERERPK